MRKSTKVLLPYGKKPDHLRDGIKNLKFTGIQHLVLWIACWAVLAKLILPIPNSASKFWKHTNQ